MNNTRTKSDWRLLVDAAKDQEVKQTRAMYLLLAASILFTIIL